jgi:uncharacterized protein
MSPNRLQYEKSPYLLQHAHNPVDWYPWCEEAFEKARLEDKPVFLSIGYSTCHWCHVMERESFEDEKTAALLNESFVNIKVDREERPDIDAIYMKACHLLSQTGGWPLSILLTTDKQPFFAATYIPRETKFGRTGLIELIPKILSIWKTRRPEIIFAAAGITEALHSTAADKPLTIDENVLHNAYKHLSMNYDKFYGGFNPSPKFPSPHNFFFLLRYWKRREESQALLITEHTLQAMRRGGIYDHIGFGFHRYSTDAKWTVPHFEKMLYDQSLMAMAYIEAFQATGNSFYERTAREIFTYVLRDMTDPDGGFYSAEDADSEGTEGKFYLWSPEELRAILGTEDADFFLSLYFHSDDAPILQLHEIPSGFFIPHLKQALGIDEIEVSEGISGKIEKIRNKLFTARGRRIRPNKDDKILTDWNSLMIAALARGAMTFNEQSYTDAATKAMDFILHNLCTENGGLLHRYRDGETSISGTIDDYSFVIWALLDLYELSFNTSYLKKSFELASHLFSHFQDKDGSFFFTSSDAEPLITRPKEFFDSAIPSGNSVMLMNILRMARISGDPSKENKASGLINAFSGQVEKSPAAFSFFLSGLDFAIGSSSEVIITGKPDGEDTLKLLHTLRKTFSPNKVVMLNPEGVSENGIKDIAPFTGELKLINGKATAHVCSNFTCMQPTNDPETMIALLNNKRQ